MNWTGFWTIFFLATIKFSVSTVPGPHLGMSYFESVLASFAGGTACALVSYFASDIILILWQKRTARKHKEMLARNITPPKKKKFKRMNRFVVRIKMKLGQVGICFYAPFFLSIPVGCIVAAKFYGKRWETFPLILLGLAFNASLTSILVYFVFN